MASDLPGTVKPGKSLLEAADDAEKLERARYAVSVARTKQVELLRRSDLRWLDADGAWVLPVGADQVMILVPLPGDGTADEWNVWRSPKGGAPVLESGKPLALDWARGVGEEVARAQGSVLSNANAEWRKKPASTAQRAALERMGHGGKLDGLTRGGASDLMTVRDAEKVIRRLGKQR